jgi:hypothetical protein
LALSGRNHFPGQLQTPQSVTVLFTVPSLPDAKTQNSENIFGYSNIILSGPFVASFATLLLHFFIP